MYYLPGPDVCSGLDGPLYLFCCGRGVYCLSLRRDIRKIRKISQIQGPKQVHLAAGLITFRDLKTHAPIIHSIIHQSCTLRSLYCCTSTHWRTRAPPQSPASKLRRAWLAHSLLATCTALHEYITS